MGLDKEYSFYIKNRDKLLKKYLNKWIAIKDNKIIGCYNDLGDAVEITSINHKFGTFMVKQVLEKEPERVF